MSLNRYFLFGSSVGLALPALLIGFSVVTGHVFESRAVAVAILGFLPFTSTDPEQEMSWLATALAFLLNALAFGILGVILSLLRKRGAQPDAPADGLRPPLN
jgi:ABC-type polysaccharide/polyol phosphate export permease